MPDDELLLIPKVPDALREAAALGTVIPFIGAGVSRLSDTLFASRLAMAGVGIRGIQEALGHKSIAMTVRYSHLSPDFVQDAVDKLAPQPPDEQSNRTDTPTDTRALESAKPPTESVH